MKLQRFSIGTGDRFGMQGTAQLEAIRQAVGDYNIPITPVWNKSQREHEIIGTKPIDVRREADRATKKLGWSKAYFVDADHITIDTVEPFLPCSNFFTMDVADYIGKKADPEDKGAFLQKNNDLVGELEIKGVEKKFKVTKDFLSRWADQYLLAIKQAKKLYEYIENNITKPVVLEISMDEVDTPQTPVELYVILKTVAAEGIPINTIAPKFTGNFYKGIDYEGDVGQFKEEFEQDLLVIDQAVKDFGLPEDLKLSVHSGSDKFSLYPVMHNLLNKHGAGVHLKTSGTTWLAELTGLAQSGPEGLKMVKKIYSEAYGRFEELIAPYKPVVNIDHQLLPDPKTFAGWTGDEVASKVEHNPDSDDFNPSLRQFLHCSYKVAAEQGAEFLNLLQKQEKSIASRVTNNLLHRHIKPLFVPDK